LPLRLWLFFAAEETYPRSFSLQASTLLHGLHILINLHFIQGILPVFAMFPLETSFVPELTTLNVVAETTVEQSTVYFK
jgi:hypothetical protein